MRFDLHVHYDGGDLTGRELVARMNAAGIDGGVVLSESPIAFLETELRRPKERIDRVMKLTEGCDTLFPFFFIDPTEPDALEQVDMAVEAGIRGFKTICTHFFPDDPRAVPVYHKIAATGKPYLFHSGILYDGSNASGNFNRPCNFEVLLNIPRLRFALAHISWPWCDECIAVFGKFMDYLSHSKDADAPEMFVDITPGTPRLYRKDALAKLFDMPQAANQVLWGSDNHVRDYNIEHAQTWRARDEQILHELELPADTAQKLYEDNFRRFLGIQ